MPEPSPPPGTEPNPVAPVQRWWIIWTFLVLLVLVGIYASYNSYLASVQREAAQHAIDLGGRALLSFQHPSTREPSAPQWLRDQLGDDFFYPIVVVDLKNQAKVTDADLDFLTRLPKVRWLMLDRTQVTDAAIPKIKQLPQLAQLHLRDTGITQAGLRKLRAAFPKTQIWPLVQ